MNARDKGGVEPFAGSRLLSVSLAIADYDRTRPLIDGRISPEGIRLGVNPKWIAEFCERPVYEEYDAAEMSMSWYVAARTRGEPVVALPVFPLRMPVFAYVLCRKGAPYKHPKDLIGKRIGVGRYRYTVNLWLRGLFKEHYGVSPEQFTWVTGGEEEAGFVVPPGITVEIRKGAKPEELLAGGDVDAVLHKLRVIAVAGQNRNPVLPDVPTVGETLPGFVSMQWTGLAAPPGTPAVIAERLHVAVAEALQLPDVSQRLKELSLEPVGSPPAQTAAFWKQERERWGKIIRLTGAKAD